MRAYLHPTYYCIILIRRWGSVCVLVGWSFATVAAIVSYFYLFPPAIHFHCQFASNLQSQPFCCFATPSSIEYRKKNDRNKQLLSRTEFIYCIPNIYVIFFCQILLISIQNMKMFSIHTFQKQLSRVSTTKRYS